MKISIDPMAPLRAAKVEKLNVGFNLWTQDCTHRDQAHAHKRQIAALVAAGGAPTQEFQHEADLRSVSALQLAETILAKPNNLARRELYRQQLMIRVAAALTPAELDAIKIDVGAVS